MKRIILLAAENGALPGGKVGGVGDVVRDLPVALAELGWKPGVLTPAYGLFSRLAGAREISNIVVPFGSGTETVSVLAVPGPDPRVEHIVFEHALFSPSGPGKVYCDDDAARPFATDAGKFAFLCATAAAYVDGLEQLPDVVHLQDWHAALYCVLREYDPRYRRLGGIRTVYTIHNLAMQGIRPLDNDVSSLRSWFPHLEYDYETVADPRYRDCVNPMAAAIRLADRLNTVSPTYANEILRPNDPDRGFNGGEGLEQDLQKAAGEGRLVGILNGCEYPKRDRRRPGWRRLLDTINAELVTWRGRNGEAVPIHELAATRIESMPRRRPETVLTSIGRLTSQKVDLFLQRTTSGRSALEAILDGLGRSGVFILLGSGDRALEQRVAEIARHHENFLFLCGYSETFSELLYRTGDLFLMPSSFEPCGISQMLAMRAAQPCVVHAVGGLRDTVEDDRTGFTFGGDAPVEQAENFVAAVRRALLVKSGDPDHWLRIRERAAAQRFSWSASAKQYIGELYE
jgi:starch synthase